MLAAHARGAPCAQPQDVIEIMKAALYDRFGGLGDDPLIGGAAGTATTDYRALGGGAGGAKARGKAAEAARFMQRVRVVGSRQGKDTFTTGELVALANAVCLQVRAPAMDRSLRSA